MNSKVFLAILELILIFTIIVFDLLIPSLLVLIIGLLFVIYRKERVTFFDNPVWEKPFKFIFICFGLGVAITMFNYALVIPILNHITNSTQNMNIFAELKGNTSLLLFLLAYSWLFAALIEEFAYRGFFQHRLTSLFNNQKTGIFIAVVMTSALFGIMHFEQGLVGILNTALDAVLFSIIRYKFKSIWASVLVHGFSNTIGIVAFYFLGPLHGLW